MKQIIFSFIMFFISFSTFAQSDSDFVYVTSSDKGDDWYVYIEKSYGDTTEFWAKYNTPIKIVKGKNGKSIKKGGDKVIYFVTLDCSDKTYSTSNMVMYDRLGKVTSRPSYLDEYNERVVPGSVMSALYRYVCNNE